MQSIRSLASLLSAVLLLAACQTTLPTQQSQSAQIPQSLASESIDTDQNPVFQGHFEVQTSGNNSQISFVPKQSADFSTQALRRSEIKKYRMKVVWPGNSTGVSTTVDAETNGTLGGQITVTNIPGGNFRSIVLEALDSGDSPIKDLVAGHVYNLSTAGPFNANSLITRSGRAIAAAMIYFSDSTVSGDVTIFNAWKANPVGTLTDLNTLVNTVLAGKDPIALNVQDLITAIQAKADGTMPIAANVSTSVASNVILTYTVPAGSILPAGTKLSLDMASSETITQTPQTEGTHTVSIPNVYLPLVSRTNNRILRFFSATDTTNATPLYNATIESVTLDKDGIQATTMGSPGNPLALPAGLLTPLATSVAAGSTFYVNTGLGTDIPGNGSVVGTPWKKLSYAIAQIKAKTLAGEFDADTIPTLSVAAGTYAAEGNLKVDFPIHILGTTGVIIDSAGTFTLGQDTTNSNYETSASKRISLSNLTMTGVANGFKVTNASILAKHLTLSNITATGTGGGVGFKVESNASVDDLIMSGCSFTGFTNGFSANATKNTPSYFSNASISSTIFSENKQKGVYLEKADNVSFDNITIDHSGMDVGYANNNGFSLNLIDTNALGGSPKAYHNISLTNSSITDSGYQTVDVFPRAYARTAVAFAVSEAVGNLVTLTGLTITGNTISGPMQALRIASPDYNITTGSLISGITVENNTLALETNGAYDSSRGRFLIINSTKNAINAATNTFDGVSPATATGAEAPAIEEKISDELDFNKYQTNYFVSGRVSTGLAASNRVSVPFLADGSNIQAAINAAQVGDTLVLGDGVYTPAEGLSINVNKDITLEGQSLAGTVFQRSVTAGRPTTPAGSLFNLSAAGATLRNLTIQKMEKTGEDRLIYLGANNLTVENMTISGQFASGDAEVSRAMIGQAGITGLTIQNNVISNLRQPAYISGAIALTGRITNNQVYGTKGWVIEGAQINFSGNTWRSDGLAGASGNIGCDIALLKKSLALVPADYMAFYGDTTALEAANTGDLLDVVGAGMGGCDQRLNP